MNYPSIDTINQVSPIGWWTPGDSAPMMSPKEIRGCVYRVHEPFSVVVTEGCYAVVQGGEALLGSMSIRHDQALPLVAHVNACSPERLGDDAFCRDHGVEYPYVAGAMANGISSEALVEAMSQAGMLAFFGSAGLSLDRVEVAIDRLQTNLGDRPYGFNLINSPNEKGLEEAVVDLYLRRGVNLVSASAYMALSLAVVKFRVHGIHRNDAGEIVTPNRVVAKVSRVEVATKFCSPPPEKMLAKLVGQGMITDAQAELASHIPMAQDITAEADSGGHTDRRAAIVLLPTLCALRDRLQAEYGYAQAIRVGLGGGIATPVSAAAAFSMGAAYVLTGTINQACVEAGTCDEVRGMLSDARQADVTMAPAADMFEMGVEVQVLKRGTMFAMRGHKLYSIYRACDSLDAIPADERAKLEKDVFRAPLDEVWSQTESFFRDRDPHQLEKAAANPKHKMALVFRWYLGQSSNWANRGVPDRKVDYQVWCGPSMGAFNEWTKGSFLELPASRKVVTVAHNLLLGAAVTTRLNSLRQQGVHLPPEVSAMTPLELNVVREYLSKPVNVN